MGTNSSKFDREAYYNAMSTKELEGLRDKWLKWQAERDGALIREELAYIRMKIAERIGNKGQ